MWIFQPLFNRLKTQKSSQKQLLTPAKALDEFFSFFKNRVTFHKRRPYQHSICSCLDHSPDILCAVHPTLTYNEMPGPVVKVVLPDNRCKFFRNTQVDIECLKVPVVNPDNPCSGFQRKLKLFSVMDFNDRLKSLLKGKLDKVAKLFFQDARNEKHEIAFCFLKLHSVNDEIFPEDRQTYIFPDCIQVFK